MFRSPQILQKVRSANQPADLSGQDVILLCFCVSKIQMNYQLSKDTQSVVSLLMPQKEQSSLVSQNNVILFFL